MNPINYWWSKFQNLRILLALYKQYHNLKDVEECVAKLMQDAKLYNPEYRCNNPWDQN